MAKKSNKLDLDLESMINDLTESHNFNNYSPYWNNLAQNHIKLLNENGIENFKQTIEEKNENGKCIIKYPKKMYCEYNNNNRTLV